MLPALNILENGDGKPQEHPDLECFAYNEGKPAQTETGKSFVDSEIII